MVVQIAKNFTAMPNCEDSIKVTCNVQAEDLKIFLMSKISQKNSF